MLACNGVARAADAAPSGPANIVAGVRFKAWQPAERAAPDHPGAGAAGVRRLRPLDRPQPGRLTHHVAHPGGRSYETFPVNANEAEARRRVALLPVRPHAGRRCPSRARAIGAEHPRTLDLRRFA